MNGKESYQLKTGQCFSVCWFRIWHLEFPFELIDIRLVDFPQKTRMENRAMVSVADYEQHAYNVLPSFALEYYKSGADQEQTLRDNREAFKR